MQSGVLVLLAAAINFPGKTPPRAREASWQGFRGYIDAGLHVSIRSADMRDDAPVAGAFERVETRPVVGKRSGLEKMDFDGSPFWVKSQPRIAEVGSPAG